MAIGAKLGRVVRPWYGPVRPRMIQEGVWVHHRRCLDEGKDIGRVYGPQGRTSTVHPIRIDQRPGSALFGDVQCVGVDYPSLCDHWGVLEAKEDSNG